MLGRIHQWRSLGMEFLCRKILSYKFKFSKKTWNYLGYLFLRGFDVYFFQGICSCYLSYWIHWHKVVNNILITFLISVVSVVMSPLSCNYFIYLSFIVLIRSDYKFIYLFIFLTMLDLRCFPGFSLAVDSGGCSLAVVIRFL